MMSRSTRTRTRTAAVAACALCLSAGLQLTAGPGVAGAAAAGSGNLLYGGGVDGIGVTTGPEQVYLVFWGSQWGAQAADPSGYLTLSGDPDGMAPYLQGLFKGLGTGGETWSGVMTQYCDGVPAGAQTCPSTAPHVAYPSGGALAGVWADESAAAPQQASGAQIAQEAVDAAGHFGNTSPTSNRDAQYVIVSPTGTNPDGFPDTGFCAWHDWNGDLGVPSGYGDIAFTNLPYIPDAGATCGAGQFGGLLDGVSLVEGAQYAETITDQNPLGGWSDASGNENAGKCGPGAPGAAAGVLPLPTGNFPLPSTWANDANGGAGACEFSHPIVP